VTARQTPPDRGDPITMTLYGANPEQLEQLGSTLKAQIQAIDAVVSSVTSTLANTTWTGPARDRFQSDWDGSFRSALAQLNSAFEAAGGDCVVRAGNVRAALGVA
jgi:uncharacterized protein YukE